MHPIQDLRFALRTWRRSPVFATVAVLSLALGIGANTSIFSVMDALMLRTLPVRQPEQLVLFGKGLSGGIFDNFPREHVDLFSQPFWQQARAKGEIFSDVCAIESLWSDGHARFGATSNDLEPVKARLVSGNYFAVLGVGPSAGRVLTAADDTEPGANPVAVLSHAFWQRRFGLAPDITGRTFSFNGTIFTIAGVAAPEFFGTVVGDSPDLWIPLSMQGQAQPSLGHLRDDLSQSLYLIGRMKPGVTLPEAQANINVLFQRWLRQIAGASPSPERLDDMRKAGIDLTPAGRGFSSLRQAFSQPLRILMAVVGVVLLIACANVANLLLARAAGREREIAIRGALGAGRAALVGQLLSESLLLGLSGGALGVLVAWWGGQLLVAMVSRAPDPVPLQVGPNLHALLFTFALSLATGLLFGIAPALRMTRADAGPSLKAGRGTTSSRSHSRLGQALVAGQVALALFLMIGAGLFVRTLQKLDSTSAGFDQDRVAVLTLDRDSSSFKGPAFRSLCSRIEERIGALPGVEAASFCMLNFGGGRWTEHVWPEGAAHIRATSKPSDANRVGARYFQALGVPVLLGRTFGPQETASSKHAAIVNETMARALFPNASALGRHFPESGQDRYDYEIVGVVADSHYQNLREKPRNMWFVSTEQEQDLAGYSELVVRLSGKTDALIPQIRAVIRSEDPNLAVAEVTTLGERVAGSLRLEKLLAKLASFFGALALLLASIGLYGVMAYAVARRTNEIGIRMALGARPGVVMASVLREALTLSGLGLAIGIPAALACGRLVANQLYGVRSNDPFTIAAAAAILATVAAVSALIPALGAARVDPLEALRAE